MSQLHDEPTIRLLRETAAGPMSAVFVAEMHTRLGPRRVAVKLLREMPDGGVDRLLELRDRARALGALSHRHHATVTDVARVDERFALIGPYVDGIDLLDWMDVLAETGRVMPRRVTCEILRGVASALEAAAHWRAPGASAPLGITHRDIKPSNVIVGRDGSLRVTDFGTGYTALAGKGARAGALQKGLVRYISPERREGGRATPGADVYALGILAVELFRGRWLRRLRTKNPAHDRQFADVVARLDDLQMRSDSDDRALRNLLLRMIAYESDARPEITEVVATFRTLADRAEGPSLEAFAIAHAVPWMDDPPAHADDGLADARAVIVERGQPLPPAGGGLPIITLTDRYEAQLDAQSGDTGEWSAEELTDPRLRAAGADAADLPPMAPHARRGEDDTTASFGGGAAGADAPPRTGAPPTPPNEGRPLSRPDAPTYATLPPPPEADLHEIFIDETLARAGRAPIDPAEATEEHDPRATPPAVARAVRPARSGRWIVGAAVALAILAILVVTTGALVVVALLSTT